jgi:hypothetical protein
VKQILDGSRYNKKENGVLREAVQRLYEGIKLISFIIIIGFHATHENVISFKPVRNVWLSLSLFSRNS